MIQPSAQTTDKDRAVGGGGVVGWLIRNRLLLLCIAVLLAIVGAWPASKLQFDTGVENMFPRDDPVLRDYLRNRRLFGNDEIIVVAYRDPRLLTPEGLLRVHQLAKRLRQIGPAVGQVTSLADSLDMGTPMIAAVSMGISVGFSIHYLYRFRQERRAGASFENALHLTHRGVGGAMVLSNLALVIGFGVLCLSNFIPTVHFSILVNVALLGGLAGNLMVLPVLLRVILNLRFV